MSAPASDGKPTFKAVFTNLKASGRIAPTTLGSHYTGQDHDGQVTLSSGVQQWTVPYTGDYRIEAIAAAGGYDIYPNSIQNRGRGAKMIGTFRLNKSEIIHILVGQEGGINTDDYSSGGGGGTFVVRGANTPLIIAGGGGGVDRAWSRHKGCDASTNTTGNPGYQSYSGGSNGHGAQTANDGWSELRLSEVFQKYYATIPVKSTQFFTGLSRNAATLLSTKVADCLIAYCKRSKNSGDNYPITTVLSERERAGLQYQGYVLHNLCKKHARTVTVESQQVMAILKAGKLDCINDSKHAKSDFK
ncbi:hypothetical protein AWC38_SpisGene23573 [Stylophora pistillata]|uniref:receptor protein-tyrosine kinase n=1 Tax=Stylophora pistillata TaxID=50429 RepID=A0A2B4R6N3_STYPI|nr:hypothetical protein AWC38_SpisGene23573 [Stylophora pistillata]